MTPEDTRSPADQARAAMNDDLRWAIRRLCAEFPDQYWRDGDAARAYPDAFVNAVTEARPIASSVRKARASDTSWMG